MDKLHTEDNGFVFLFILLFTFSILNFATGSFSFLFYAPPNNPSLFAVISSSLILLYFVIWGFIRLLRSQLKGKRLGGKAVSRIMLLRTSNLVGIRKPTLKSSAFIIVCMVIGVVVNFVILFILSRIGYGTLYRITSPPIENLLQNLIVPPIFEEFIYRGIYLGVFLKLFGKSYKYSSLALVMSAFTFGWTHPAQPIVKTVGGILLGSVYLFGWRKNLLASSMTHFGMNLVGSFFILIS